MSEKRKKELQMAYNKMGFHKHYDIIRGYVVHVQATGQDVGFADWLYAYLDTVVS